MTPMYLKSSLLELKQLSMQTVPIKSQKHDELLQDKYIQNNILERAYRNKPLTEQQKRHNQFASQVRYVVERTFLVSSPSSLFGVFKRHYGLGQAPYNGIERNRARLSRLCIAHNLKRAVNIQRSYS